MHRSAVPLTLAALLASGCGSTNFSAGKLWPFGESGPREVAQAPGNAVEYRCDGGKRFFVRGLGENAVWLIAPDREIRLERIGGADSRRYGVARVELALAGDEATLFDPPATFSGCRRAEAGK